MFRKLTALAFGLLAFNLLFFPFNEHYAPPLTIFLPGTIWFFLCIACAQVFTFWLFYSNRSSQKQRYATWASLAAIGFPFLALWRANEVDHLLLGAFSIVLTGVSFYLFSLSHDEFGALSEIISVFPNLFGGWFEGGFKMIQDVVKAGSATPKFRLPHKNFSGITIKPEAQMGIPEKFL